VSPRIYLATAAAALAAGVPAHGAYYDTFVAPEPGERFAAADYRLWVPDGVKYHGG
jgi:hypothetical protein